MSTPVESFSPFDAADYLTSVDDVVAYLRCLATATPASPPFSSCPKPSGSECTSSPSPEPGPPAPGRAQT